MNIHHVPFIGLLFCDSAGLPSNLTLAAFLGLLGPSPISGFTPPPPPFFPRPGREPVDNLHIDHLHRHRHTALAPRLSSPWSVKLVDTYKTRLRIPYLPVGLELRLVVLHLAASASALASASSSTSFPLTLSRLGLVKTAGWRLLHFAARISSRWVVLLLIVFCQSHPFGPADFYLASRRSPVSVVTPYSSPA
ncbi:hypothetical protein NW767_000441 [Fusarium falciforme]|nr:hypothetical protein NW767_000441 [Fusarium falciforme]